MPTMKLGEICEIIVSSEYGYRDEKTRHFEIELLDLFGTLRLNLSNCQ